MKRIFIFVSALIVSSLIGGVVFAALSTLNASQNTKNTNVKVNALYVYNQKTLKNYATNTEYKSPPTPVKNQEFTLIFEPYYGAYYQAVHGGDTPQGCKTDDKGLIYWDFIKKNYKPPPKYVTTLKMLDNVKNNGEKLYYWEISPDLVYTLGTVNTALTMKYWDWAPPPK
ncbi:MAG: hypothetical protein WC624_03975 [Candidatus Margulisiibacteriota bacterium]